MIHLRTQVREELISLTPNNASLVGEVRAVLGQEKLVEMLEGNKLDARQVQVIRVSRVYVSDVRPGAFGISRTPKHVTLKITPQVIR